MAKKVKVIPMDNTYKRYVVVDAESQKVLDDSQGMAIELLKKHMQLGIINIELLNRQRRIQKT
ncbi:hypothetical protein [Lactobacillus sp. LL6]|uniref:hypothetical protein n=1 Tax=Lactobacillus sp. LL6 TaxID=2596827 RepID=UPI00118527FC|nr:hypothetical protein [Lactobacillus sp. LL6]TSO25431.1 hypothetical protein FOD82_09380 [Lactobacillus sp. LL6]